MLKRNPNLLLFLLLACLWSGSFIGIKVVVTNWPPLFGAVVRIGLSLFCISLLIMVNRKKVLVPLSLRWKIWVMGLFSQGIPFALLFWGEQKVSAGLAGILNGTVSLWIFLLALVVLPKVTKFSMSKFTGLLLGLLGVVIIFWPLLSLDKSMLVGAAAILVMAISYAIGGVLNQYFLTGETPIDFFTNIFHQQVASFIFLLVVSLLLGQWPSVRTLISEPEPWLASLYLGVFSTAIAWIIYYHLIREWDGVRASSVMYIVPVLTLLWDYLFYGLKPGISEIMGVVIILAGVTLVQFSALKKALTK